MSREEGGYYNPALEPDFVELKVEPGVPIGYSNYNKLPSKTQPGLLLRPLILLRLQDTHPIQLLVHRYPGYTQQHTLKETKAEGGPEEARKATRLAILLRFHMHSVLYRARICRSCCLLSIQRIMAKGRRSQST
ncbi:uncharacterized protein LOC135468361 [Liolophura sinensis]|uniref:uncharacterized protein LOC135468361 n=1 Tax=Liolophura sinensis TaxID=3198878 RepID=UPI003159600B